MKHFLLSTIAAVSLIACATGPSAYGPAATGNGLGFENTKIESDRFRINYTGRSAAEAQDFALLRAAEIALDEGYSHFRIISGQTSQDQPASSGVSTSVGVGIGGGRGYRRGGTSVGIGIGLNDLGRSLAGQKVTNSIEIKLLRSGSDDPNVFDAREVSGNIKPEVFQ